MSYLKSLKKRTIVNFPFLSQFERRALFLVIPNVQGIILIFFGGSRVEWGGVNEMVWFCPFAFLFSTYSICFHSVVSQLL